MCCLITFALPERDTPPPVPGQGEAAFVVAPFCNAGGGHCYPAGLRTWSITAGGCSCGLFTPASVLQIRARQAAAREARYRAQGWSAAKIGRALQAHAASAAQRACEPGFTAPVREYLASSLNNSPVLYFLLHDHRDVFTTETFEIIGQVSLTKAQLHSGTPCPEYDRLYLVPREPPVDRRPARQAP